MAAQVNGDLPGYPMSSAFFQHLLRYPLIHDGITTFRQNEYGQRSLRLGDSAYKTFAAPVVPYLSRPYELVEPYVKKADEVGDQTLCKVDERFPVVKKPTGELYDDAVTVVLMPYRKGIEGRDHVVGLYSDEYRKVGGDGLVTHAKTLVTTVLIVSTETFSVIGSWLRSQKVQAKEGVSDKGNN